MTTPNYNSYKANYREKVIDAIHDAGKWVVYQDDENELGLMIVDLPHSIKNLEQIIHSIR